MAGRPCTIPQHPAVRLLNFELVSGFYGGNVILSVIALERNAHPQRISAGNEFVHDGHAYSDALGDMSANGVELEPAACVRIDISSVMTDLEPRLMEMDLGPLFGLWFQSLFIGITMWALYICIFIVIYGRMIEIYLVTSVAPVPMAAMMGKEWGGMGQNYLRSLLALGFQAFLIIVCVAIYAVLVQNIALEDDIIMAIWSCVGYTVLLCFTLFKTGSLAKSVFQAH